jgi:hypothetical protein
MMATSLIGRVLLGSEKCEFASRLQKNNRIFADGMKRQLYIFQLMMATLMVLLSTVVLHHHHEEGICTVGETCRMDGNKNDSHTAHHGQEKSGCVVQLMHQFVVKASSTHSQSPSFHTVLPVALLPQCLDIPFLMGSSCRFWGAAIVRTFFVPYRFLRRGPPSDD